MIPERDECHSVQTLMLAVVRGRQFGVDAAS